MTIQEFKNFVDGFRAIKISGEVLRMRYRGRFIVENEADEITNYYARSWWLTISYNGNELMLEEVHE